MANGRIKSKVGEHEVNMKIINIEKLDLSKPIVMTGRNKNVMQVAKSLRAILYHCPREEDYFMDYPAVANELRDSLMHENRIVIVTTQSKEFLDCLLESDIDFTLATVRKYDHDDVNTYRLRVLTKKEALENRRNFDMELRI